MSEYGLKIRGATGVVQIDSMYSNYALLKKVKVTVRDQGNSNFFGEYSTVGEEPSNIYAVKASSGILVCAVTLKDKVTIYGTHTTFECDLFVFTKSKNVTKGSYGLLVRNKQGEVVFNSNSKYMRVLASYEIAEPKYKQYIGNQQYKNYIRDTFPPNLDIALVFGGTLHTSKREAFVMTEQYYYMVDTSDLTCMNVFDNGELNEDHMDVFGDQVMHWGQYAGGGTWSNLYGMASVLAIDVTNF